MRLYQHSVRCPVAMQIFLDANPQYWRFVPMTLMEADTPEQQSIEEPILYNEFDCNRRSEGDTLLYVASVPKPPQGYVFSKRQLILQTEYFHHLRDKNLPNQNIDLYNATVVAVCKSSCFRHIHLLHYYLILVPDPCTDMFRLTIESLFITHADTSLNTIGNVLNQNELPEYNPWLTRADEWCQGLLRRPQPKAKPTTK